VLDHSVELDGCRVLVDVEVRDAEQLVGAAVDEPPLQIWLGNADPGQQDSGSGLSDMLTGCGESLLTAPNSPHPASDDHVSVINWRKRRRF
jgi:hypothetical protein